MGGKRKVHVSSVTYNLAGPEDPDAETFLKTNLFAAIKNSIGNADVYVGTTLTRNYLNGPGVKLRLFQKWAKELGYTSLLGITGGNIRLPTLVDHSVFKNAINPSNPDMVEILSYEYEIADYGVWAMQYMALYYPELFNSHWNSEYNASTNQIIINLLDGPAPPLDSFGEPMYPDEYRPVVLNRLYFTPPNYDPNAYYLYAAYMDILEKEDGPVIEGTPIIVSSLPSTLGYSLVEDNTALETYDLTDTRVTVISYSDGRPDEVINESAPETATALAGNAIYDRTEYVGADIDNTIENITYTERHIRTLHADHYVAENTTVDVTTETFMEDDEEITKTITETTTVRTLYTTLAYRDDVQKIEISGYSATKVFIYKMGSGNPTLDALAPSSTSAGEFFPFIPVRVQGVTLNSSHGWEYKGSKIAFKKAVGGDYDQLRKTINDSPSIGDIDSAFVTFGVPINVKNNSGKAYLYKFFQMILEGQTTSQYALWETQVANAHMNKLNWDDWVEAQKDPLHPRYNTSPPTLTPFPAAPAGSLRIKSNHWAITYDISIHWTYIAETYITGLYKPGAKKGQYWIEKASGATAKTFELRVNAGTKSTMSNYNSGGIMFVWQESADLHRVILVRGLRHANIIFDGKGVSTYAEDALSSSEDTGFVVPLHDRIYKEISLIHATEISKVATFVTFNSYKVTRTKWYQSGAFKLFVVIAVVMVSVFFPPAGGIAGGAGVLGTNASVGAAIGATATTAAIIGATLNAIAAIAITHIIVKATTKLLGAEIGMIVGTLASMYAIQGITSYHMGNGWAPNFAEMMKADNLIKLSDSVAKTVVGNIERKAQAIMEKSEEVMAEYEKETQRIKDLWEQNIDGGSPNLLELAEAASKFNFRYEPPSNFLERTLMTGTDIAQLSQKMIEEFANITTDLTLP